MSLFGFFRKESSAPVARERLQILLAYERSVHGQTDLLAVLREEILAAVARHVPVDPEKVDVKMKRGETISTLEVDIEFDNMCAMTLARAS